MTEQDHILVCLMEECSEVSKDVCKALRFGLGDADPSNGVNNRLRIATEWAEVVAVGEMLIELGAIEDLRSEKFISDKREKVLRYMEYARNCGKVE